MAARKSSRVNPKYKKKYRPKNWAEYEAGLRSRGDVQVWLDQDAIDAWKAPPSGKPGDQQIYSDTAILTVLSLSLVFNLPLRQTEGLVGSLMRLMDLDLDVPDHSTLTRRRKSLEVPKLRRTSKGRLHVVVDSSGLNIYGAGEWCSHKHKSKDRRSWRGLHIGVDEHGDIVACMLTDGDADDATTAVKLLDELDEPIHSFTADGAYDRRKIYRAVAKAGTPGAKVVVPPSRRAVPSDSSAKSSEENPESWSQRDDAVKLIDEVGRLGWEKASGYRQQGGVENAFYRFKRTFGASLRSRSMESQSTEALIACRVLNQMLAPGRPECFAIEA